MSTDWKSYIKLCALPDIGSITAMRLIEAFGSPQAALEASKEELMQVEKIGEKTAKSILANRGTIDVDKICDRMNFIGARYIDFKDPIYPQILLPQADKPIGFYSIGESEFNTPCISIIGSRNCTVYGQLVARKFAAAFARAGFTVVSGMARGIDSAAHIGALEAGGKTIAVLGSGVDVIYPPENTDLYKRIINQGSVISEFPLGARADRQTFPIRNRIVAGLSLACLVVESDKHGGSMITARIAAELGKDVYAIPGRIDSSSSRGCHALIRDGATLVTSPEEIIDELKSSGQIQMSFEFSEKSSSPKGQNIFSSPTLENEVSSKKSPEKTIKLSDDETKVFACFESAEFLTPDEIAEKSGLSISKCLAILLMMEIKKILSKSSGGKWCRRGN